MRQKEFDENEVLEEAMRVFWLKGYEGTSIQDLQKAMGLSRASIYNAFGSKSGLYQRVLDKYISAIAQNWLKAFYSGITFEDSLKNFLDTLFDQNFSTTHPSGCLTDFSYMELASHDKSTAKKIFDNFDYLLDLISIRIKKAVDDGELDKKTDVESLTYLFIIYFHGIMLLGRLGRLKENSEDIKKHIINSFAAYSKK